MANKFTKSVLERQAKEFKAHAQDAPPVREVVAEPAPEAVPEPETPTAPVRVKRPPAAQFPDLTAFIVKEENRAAKNKTFYLDAAVIDALHRAASSQKITDSKLVNDILKKLLGV